MPTALVYEWQILRELPSPGLHFPFFIVNTSHPQSEKLQFHISLVIVSKRRYWGWASQQMGDKKMQPRQCSHSLRDWVGEPMPKKPMPRQCHHGDAALLWNMGKEVTGSVGRCHSSLTSPVSSPLTPPIAPQICHHTKTLPAPLTLPISRGNYNFTCLK